MKGIILAGGSGSRLYPMTLSTSKQLLPVYDKPMVYYPLSVLMLANIREILLVTTPEHLSAYQTLLGNGKHLGIQLDYAVQEHPTGLADVLSIGEHFVGNDPVCLILGDNLFWGQGFSGQLEQVSRRIERKGGAAIFTCQVNNPQQFGVVKLDANNTIEALIEKPVNPPSNLAITGLYFYDNQAIKLARSIQPSARGEKEITTLNQLYLEQQQLHIEQLGRGFAWIDMGTPQRLFEASQFVESIQRQRGYYIACLEEIALLKGWTNAKLLGQQIKNHQNTAYGSYLHHLI